MPVKRPDVNELCDVAHSLNIHLSTAQASAYHDLLQGNFDAYDAIDALPDFIPRVTYSRTPGYRPSGEENKYGAWYVKTTIPGGPAGPLAGKSVALKDTVCLAGVPMMIGASTFEGYVPEIDATIVTRLLDAGATILGKSACEYFCFSGGSHTGASGPVHNPHRLGYSAGGSSSGSAALLAAGEVDLATGGDQGGSIRIPASYCGVYGMMGTHGLVPYTGVLPIELTLDRIGPMSTNVTDNATMLEVMAGPDGLDPRQHAGRASKPYSQLMKTGVRGMRIGMLAEGFGWPNSDPAVDAKVHEAAAVLARLGATICEVSVPMHRTGPAIWLPIAAEGATQQMMKGNSHGFNWKGLYATSMIDHHAGWRSRADQLSDPLKMAMVLGEYFVKHYRGRYYAKAQNLARRLAKAYDAALADVDLMLMPTVPITATPLPAADAPVEEVVGRAWEMLNNTCPFNVTGHPAMSLPCGLIDGLPVGMMLVGRHWEEETIYRAAFGFEQGVDWRSV